MEIALADIKVSLPKSGKPLFEISKFEVPSGQHLLIEGASGAGKTTFLHLVAGLFLPDSGRIKIGGYEISSMKDDERSRFRKENVGIVFQRLNLLEHLTSLENVMLSLAPGLRESVDRSRAALKAVDLTASIDERSSNLSLGEQQRVAVARVLASKPSLILADEPTSSLDERNANLVANSLIQGAKGKTLIVVSHDRRIKELFPNHIDFKDLASR